MEEGEEWATEGARKTKMAAALAVLFGRASKLGAKVGTAVKAASVAARLFVALHDSHDRFLDAYHGRPPSWQSRQGDLRPRLPER